jgi:hypothetical protein
MGVEVNPGRNCVTEGSMKKTAFLEPILLLIFSFLGIAEGLRLNLTREARTAPSMLGPGTYILVLGFGLLITAIFDFLLNYRDISRTKKADLSPRGEIPVSGVVVALIGIFAMYAVLIDIVGYLIPTISYVELNIRHVM